MKASTVQLAGLVALAMLLGGCAGDIPETQLVVPQLELGRTPLRAVMRAYGQPRQRTSGDLWYVGPGPVSLTHGTDGWMTLLTFDELGFLQTQEYLHRGLEQNYLQVDYSIQTISERRLLPPGAVKPKAKKPPTDRTGKVLPELREPFSERNRDSDFDQLMIARCVVLAASNQDYRITTHQPELFVMVRVLPGENEPVVESRIRRDGNRSLVTTRVRALPGRDEPLMEQIDAAVGKRMLLIEVVNDAEEFSPTEHAPGVRP
ncbi:MAG: hypothetical protein PHU85_11280 [Phycisphaerae bacterium]|nr:hypothetical protein [Phycisphaerae bacterium]